MVHDAKGSIKIEFSMVVPNLKESQGGAMEANETKRIDDCHFVQNFIENGIGGFSIDGFY